MIINPGSLISERRGPSSGGGGGYTGPLDIVPGAVVAYGQRALSAAKLGSALYTIRRSSDDATQSFNSDATTGAAPVSSISSFIGGGNGFVATWNDQSGNASSASQAATAAQPAWAGSSFDSIPALSFSSQFLVTQSNLDLSNAAYTVFLVINPTSTAYNPVCAINYDNFSPDIGAWAALLGQGSNADLAVFTVDAQGSPYNGPEASRRAVDVAGVWGGSVLWDSAWEFGSGSIFFNGTNVITGDQDGSMSPGAISGPLGIGSADGVTPVSFYSGSIAELIIYDSVISDANRLAIRQNIAAYYGITLP